MRRTILALLAITAALSATKTASAATVISEQIINPANLNFEGHTSNPRLFKWLNGRVDFQVPITLNPGDSLQLNVMFNPKIVTFNKYEGHPQVLRNATGELFITNSPYYYCGVFGTAFGANPSVLDGIHFIMTYPIFFDYPEDMDQPPITFNRLNFNIEQVPEPAVWSLVILGFGGIGVMLRRCRIVSWTV